MPMEPFNLFFFAIPVFGMLVGLVWFALTLYVLYDILFVQPAMEPIEKLLWVIVVLVFNILGVLAYLLVVKYFDESASEAISSLGGEERRLAQLERLGDLHENGVLTDEEFAKEKQKIMQDQDQGA